MKKLIKKMLGLDEVENNIILATQQLEKLEKAKQEAEDALKAVQREEELAKMSPKDRATQLGEPYISVMDTKINKDNPRNGFFELDWNEHFIAQLKQSGYGFDGDPDEEIVDRWFRDIVRNMLTEEGVSEPERVAAGFINITPITKNQSEVS